MHQRLLETLLRTSLAPTGDAGGSLGLAAPWGERIAPVLRAASSDVWFSVLDELDRHRVTPMLAAPLKAHRLEAMVPPGVLERLQGAHQRTELTNTVHLHVLGTVLDALAGAGVMPVLWKGAVLVDRFAPDPGARWMGDLDLAIEPSQRAVVDEVFDKLGFHSPRALDTDDAVHYLNRTGVLFDVHHRVRMFEGEGPHTIEVRPLRINTKRIKVLEPSAMVAHLVAHAVGHRGEVGDRLYGFIDLAWVFRRWGNRLDRTALQRWLEPAGMTELSAMTDFLVAELGVPRPPAIPSGEPRDRLHMGEILRSARMAPWELDRFRNWIRLSGASLNLWTAGNRPAVGLDDLLRWPLDRWVRRRAG